MSDKCARCGKSVYANDKPQKVGENVWHNACFKCAVCGTKLTMATVNSAEGDIFCKNHVPKIAPTSTIDVVTAAALNAPDATFNQREFTKGDGSSSYGAGAVGMSTERVKPPTFGSNRMM